jgi:hypothetical protein
VTGDGSYQMNLQELPTILTNRCPSYLVSTPGLPQHPPDADNFFSAHAGSHRPESGDLEFPTWQNRRAYGYDFYESEPTWRCCRRRKTLRPKRR